MRRNKDAVKKVMHYRRMKPKPLSFREIAKLMKSNVKTVYRWYQYGVGSYTQDHIAA